LLLLDSALEGDGATVGKSGELVPFICMILYSGK
jgi:hypothetical protein